MSTRLGRMSVRRAVAIFGVATLVPLLLLAYASIQFGDSGLRHQAEHRVEGVSVASGQFVNEEMNGLGEIVQSYASRPSVVGGLSTAPKYNYAELGTELDNLKNAHPGTSVTFITDTSGRLVSGRPDNPANVGLDFSFRDWYKGVTATGTTYVSNAFVSAAPGAPEVIAVATPVKDGSGKVVGYIGANYSLDALQTLMTGLSRTQNVDITVVDRAGTIVAQPGSLPMRLTSIHDESETTAALAGQSSVVTTTYNGTKVLSAYAPVPSLGWAVIANTPAHSALAPIRSLQIAVITAAIILALVMIGGLIALVLSLAERTRTEAELRNREQITRSILNASADAYIRMDTNGVITDWSGAAESTFGWTASEVVGRTVADTIIPPELRDEHWEGLRRYLETRERRMVGSRREVEALHRDGSRFPLEISIWATELDDTTVFSAFCHDITERRRNAIELAEARDRAMEASRLKSEFVANMSHEIRTPMNGVIGMTALLLRTDLTKEQYEFTQTVSHSAEALLDVINDILDFSKIEAGRMELDHVAFDLRGVIEDAGELLAGAAQAKGLELTAAVEPGVPVEVTGDPVRLRQVLLNLTGNAVKFTDSGEVAVSCKLVSADDDVEIVRFEVRDTGPGIRDEDKERLFQSFSQLDTSSTRNFGGTGLGLVISKQLVELMGGEIGVSSKLGKGSTFWFTARFERREPVVNGRGPRTAFGRGVKVLVVDDNATNRLIISKMLTAWEMNVTVVPNATAALHELRRAVNENKPFDIALLDFNMPITDGVELGKMMQDDPDTAETKRLLLTSSGERNDILAALKSGFSGCLTKPIRQSLLFDAIIDALEEQVLRMPQAMPRPAESNVEGDDRGHILIAEDNEVNQRVTEAMLIRMGHTVDIVDNGVEALSAMKSHKYAAVLMDCQMPVMDGYEAARVWRELEPEAEHLPIIAVTAHAMEGAAEKCLAAGMDDYLSKPVSWDDLEATLQTWIDHGHAIEPVPASSSKDDVTLDLTTIDNILHLGNSGTAAAGITLVTTFIDTASSVLAALDAAAVSKNSEVVRSKAHQLKGSCVTFGALRMSNLCRQLEEMTSSGDDTSSLIASVHDEFEAVKDSLNNYLTEHL